MGARTVRLGNREIPVDEYLRMLDEPVEDMEMGHEDNPHDQERCTAIEPAVAQAPTQNIIELIADFLRRFIFLKDECLYVLIATWIVATYLHKDFDFMGYLFAHSPERQSGKTRLLDIFDMLVHESTGVQISPTEAVLFRTAEGRTQLLDEVDSWRNKDDLRDVLNAGYRKGGIVTRCEKNTKSYKPTRFPVYAPRALAGIGLKILHPTTLDRTFAVAMVRQTKAERRERLRQRMIRQEAEALKGKIQKWAEQNRRSVAEVYARGEFPDLEQFSDRTMEIAEPLAAILEVTFKAEELSKFRQLLLQAIAITRTEQQSATRDHRLLKHLLALTNENDPLIGNATEIASMCANFEDKITPYTISDILRTYGFESKNIRRNGEKPLRRYTLRRAALEELVKRWVPSGEDKDDNDAPSVSTS